YFDVVTRELTAGGSRVPAGMTVVLRSGGYLFHDHGIYRGATPAARGVAGAPEFRPALELWAQVVSRPEPGLALLSAGRRDAALDVASFSDDCETTAELRLSGPAGALVTVSLLWSPFPVPAGRRCSPGTRAAVRSGSNVPNGPGATGPVRCYVSVRAGDYLPH